MCVLRSLSCYTRIALCHTNGHDVDVCLHAEPGIRPDIMTPLPKVATIKPRKASPDTWKFVHIHTYTYKFACPSLVVHVYSSRIYLLTGTKNFEESR